MPVRKFAAEFLGTAILIIVAVGTATLSFGFKFGGLSTSAGVVATALAFGFALVALVYTIGPISGCHINPAVTMGFLVSGRLGLGEAVGYVLSQAAGGLAGAFVLYGIFQGSPRYSTSVQGLGTDGYGAHSLIHLNGGGAFAAEAVLTFVFVLVVLGATSRLASAGAAGLAIGAGLAIVHLVGIPLTGTSVNPARSFGPAVVVGGAALSQLWLFIVAPLIGGLVAAIAYRTVLAKREEATAATGGSAPQPRRT